MPKTALFWRDFISIILLGLSLLLAPTLGQASGEEEGPSPGPLDQQEANQGHEIQPLTVIATKTPKAPLDSPASVSIVTEEDINSFINEHPLKPLTRLEGVYPRQYRGLADFWARPVIRGKRALVLVDGLDWHDFAYTYNFAAIPMPDVERIDVVRGPFSSLYGTLAQTGVINYITRIPRERKIEARAQYGSWDSRFFQFRFADRPFGSGFLANKIPFLNRHLGDRFFYSLSLKSRTTDGYVTTPTYYYPSNPVNDPDPSIPIVSGWERDITPKTGTLRYEIGNQGNNWYQDYGLFFKTGYDFSEHTRLWYSLNTSKLKYGWEDGKSSLVDPAGPKNLYDGDAYIQDGGDTYLVSLNPFLFTANPYSKQAMVHTVHFHHTVPGFLDLSALFGYNDKEDTVRNLKKSQFTENDNDLMQMDLLSTFHLWEDKILFTLGAQGVRETLTTHNWFLSDPFDEESISSVRERTEGKSMNAAAYVQAEITPVRFVSFYLGGRYDHWWSSDATYENIDGVHNDYPDKDKGHASPKFSVVVKPLENGCIRASYGEAFTAPSLKDRLSSYEWSGGGTVSIYYPNPDLDPEINRSWEIGTEWEFWQKRIRLKTTYFENRFEDMITSVDTEYTLPDGTLVKERRRINSDKAEVRGVETALETFLPYNLRASFHYTHNWSEYTKTKNASLLGQEVPEVPTDMWSFVFGYSSRYFDAALNYRYSDSPYYDSYDQYNDHTYGAYDSYHVVDIKVTARPMEHLALSFGVDNLFDEDYFEYYQAPGRFWLGTLSATF